MRNVGAPSYLPDGTVREALALYFQTYGLGTGGYDEPYHVVKLLGFIPITIPNPPARKRALRRHDLNHVLGSYDAIGTSGEIDIAGFEIGARGGCRGYGVAWGINLFFFALGLVSRPRRLFRSFVRARGSLNAYSLASVEGEFLERRLGDVRAELNIPDRVPAATAADRCGFALWGLLALSPLAILVAVIAVIWL
jgi:hypothetical protein